MPVWFMWVVFVVFMVSALAKVALVAQRPEKPEPLGVSVFGLIVRMALACLTLWFIAGGAK